MPTGIYKHKKHSALAKFKISLAKIGKKHSLGARKRMSISRKGVPNPHIGVKHTAEWKKKISVSVSKAKKGVKLSESHKRALSIARIGMSLSPEHRKNIGKSLIGKKRINQQSEKHPKWKGEKAGKCSKHKWVYNHFGLPTVCEFCKKDTLKVREMEWANLNHKYSRDRKDWARLCRKCHRKWDIEHNDYIKKISEKLRKHKNV